MSTSLARKAEIKTRTTKDVKEKAANVYSHWGLSLSDAINIFLVKSIEVGGLPFDLRVQKPSFDALSKFAYYAPVNSDGIPVLPADWDDGDE